MVISEIMASAAPVQADNPSYFSVPGESDVRVNKPASKSGLRQWFRRPLLRSMSANPSRPYSTDTVNTVVSYHNPRVSSVSTSIPELDPDAVTEETVYYNLSRPASTITAPAEETERYYNVPPRTRRHSVGGLWRDRNQPLPATLPAPPERPTLASTPNLKSMTLPNPSLSAASGGGNPIDVTVNVKHEQPPKREGWLIKKKSHQCCRRGFPTSSMLDVLILFSKDCNTTSLWVNYLENSFQEMQKHHNELPLKIHQMAIEDANCRNSRTSGRINNAKLQIVIVSPSFLDYIHNHPDCGIGPLLHPSSVLAVLLGVSEDQVNQNHRAVLFSYQQWIRLRAVDQDITFVRNLFEEAKTILKTHEDHMHHMQKPCFSVFPKKLKEGYNKVMISLHDPLERDDSIKVTVDKTGQILDVDYTKKNPYTLQFVMPGSCLSTSMLVTIRMEKNGKCLGCRQVKCESKMREMDHLIKSLTNPLDFICQTMGFPPTAIDQIDDFLAATFHKNCPTSGFSGLPNSIPQKKCSETFPTLLHFAAHYGLQKLAWYLLECPSSEEACSIRNNDDQTPAEMAEGAGHQQLANALRGYMEMSELSNVYQYIKMVCEKPQPTESLPDAVYCSPRPLEQMYLVPPAARPVFPPPSSESPLPAVEDEAPGSDTSTVRSSSPSSALQLNVNSDGSNETMTSFSTKEAASKDVQFELLDMIDDFKNNFCTIGEVEQLFENWKHRIDVKHSHVEKHMQLEEMRAEYQSIQQKMKEKMKRPTPFEKIAKFFQKKKHNKSTSEVQSPEDLEKNSARYVGIQKERPASSISTNSSLSSTSSGRLSTVSACSRSSMADSGNHSDSGEEKKNSGLHLGRDAAKLYKNAFGSQRIAQYEVPPPPLPVAKDVRLNNITQQKCHFPIPCNETSEDSEPYYIEGNPESIPEQLISTEKLEYDKRESNHEYLSLQDDLPLQKDSVPESPSYMNYPAANYNCMEVVPPIPPRKK